MKPSGKKSNKSNLGILIIVLIAAAAGYYFTQVDSSNSLVTQIQEKISPQDKTQNKAQSSEAAASKDQKLKFLVRESYGKSFSREERYEKLNNALTSKNLNVQVDFLGLEENTDPAKILDSDFYFENTNIFVKNRDVYKDFKPVYFIQGCFLETQLVVRKDSILFRGNINEATKVVLFKSNVISPGQLALALNLNLNPEVLYVSSNKELIREELEKGNIDAVIEDSLIKKSNVGVGLATGKAFYEKFKQVEVTKIELPCRILVMNKRVEESAANNFLDKVKTMPFLFRDGPLEATEEKLKEYMDKYNLEKGKELEKNLKDYSPGQSSATPSAAPPTTPSASTPDTDTQ